MVMLLKKYLFLLNKHKKTDNFFTMLCSPLDKLFTCHALFISI
jgi:hypothetical protein